MIELQIIGHLGKDAELKTRPDGSQYLVGSISHNDKYKDKQGQWQERTTWVRYSKEVKTPNRLNDMLLKGRLVFMRGPVQCSVYTPLGGGEPVPQMSINAMQIQLLDKGASKEQSPYPNNFGADVAAAAQRLSKAGFVQSNESEPDLPF